MPLPAPLAVLEKWPMFSTSTTDVRLLSVILEESAGILESVVVVAMEKLPTPEENSPPMPKYPPPET